MGFDKEELDLVLVPAGLLFMLAYHFFFLYRYFHRPHTTFMGYDNNDKRAWVKSIMENKEKGVSAALTVTSSNTTAATYLATISLTLCSLIGAWIANSSNIFRSELIYGDTRASTISIKYISLLTCFLLAFSCFIQAVRHLVRASYLISNPSSEVPVSSVELAVIRGGELWSLGLRALYFALNLLLWFFGPIPMFVSSIIMVLFLHYLDCNTTPLNKYGSAGN
ncbi:hypothetical protein I3843_09G064700 [Carya illinoinensis]|uniref:DUF599 domain-containing protein n=1 Tax=Carya illinoinensis TaxID=32201 RepID=A0A8T1PB71_CARIL|nr:uncharacterized protein LOC122275008 isoform X1 [Carya illinoinensis]XP_042939837.1 uncharacterized protein LOC122275008 isoform X1 [Carya illinoinensis]XP_042939838.1 uncharacterized protein LOC122275008 isoform X1 [Carya illinoinensis]KAG2687720.1 hypothetical protein I3760_09G064100 [Carya illinoinensis]KAG6641319.1 hypothetical protein CIPAW_09G064600 [Carya illinoinensis]KAG7962409.1 hypothetical protein I3843_09G064700 [Carya illinoinensis]KAG7962412.1 hypothetical protein I3843_09G0